MPPRRNRRELVTDAALHEAAHALAFRQGGLPVYSIRVHEPDHPKCGGAVLIDDLDVETDQEQQAALLGGLTGAMATAKYLRDELDWSERDALEQADACSQTDQESFVKLAGVAPDEEDWEIAQQWVQAHWEEIVELAEQLIDAGGVVTARSVL